MSARTRHYGWMVSPYSAKTRSYLRYAGVDFDDVPPNLLTFLLRIRPAVKKIVMPTVELPDGRFLHDSSVILDHFERGPQAKGLFPGGPRQRIACALLEVYADEWLPLAALHFRWNRPRNAAFAIDEFGRNAAPVLPPRLQRRVGTQLAKQMQSYLPALGIDVRTRDAIERSTRALMKDLDAVLARTPYLFGERPSLADFALYGPLFAHLYRDPGSRDEFDGLPSLRRFLDRMERPRAEGPFAADDEMPTEIESVLGRAFRDAFRHFDDLLTAIDRYLDGNPGATRLPRALGSCPFVVDGAEGSRKLVTAASFKLQRIRAVAGSLAEDDRRRVEGWLDGLGGAFVLRPIRRPLVFRNQVLVLA